MRRLPLREQGHEIEKYRDLRSEILPVRVGKIPARETRGPPSQRKTGLNESLCAMFCTKRAAGPTLKVLSPRSITLTRTDATKSLLHVSFRPISKRRCTPRYRCESLYLFCRGLRAFCICHSCPMDEQIYRYNSGQEKDTVNNPILASVKEMLLGMKIFRTFFEASTGRLVVAT